MQIQEQLCSLETVFSLHICLLASSEGELLVKFLQYNHS
jgi:hypothetical protein